LTVRDKKEVKLQSVKQFLTDNGIFFTEYPNGQLKADSVNLWITSEKWYDEASQEKGVGVNSFIAHLKKKLM
jgi:hypothetical protein